MYGLKHTLTLVRKSNDDAIFRHNDAGAGKVSLDKIPWFVPHVPPAGAEKFPLYKNIESKVSLPVPGWRDFAHAQRAALSLTQGHTLFCQITPF